MVKSWGGNSAIPEARSEISSGTILTAECRTLLGFSKAVNLRSSRHPDASRDLTVCVDSHLIVERVTN